MGSPSRCDWSCRSSRRSSRSSRRRDNRAFRALLTSAWTTRHFTSRERRRVSLTPPAEKSCSDDTPGSDRSRGSIGARHGSPSASPPQSSRSPRSSGARARVGTSSPSRRTRSARPSRTGCRWRPRDLARPRRADRRGNAAVALLANVPMVLPAPMTFHRYHLDHHRYLDVLGEDTDLPLAVRGALGRPLARAEAALALPSSARLHRARRHLRQEADRRRGRSTSRS